MSQPPWHPALQPFAVRWTTFLDKIRARLTEIENESRGAYAEVTAHDAVDSTGLSGVSSAITARLHTLRQKVDDAWSKIDGEIDAVELEDAKVGGRFRGAMIVLKLALNRELDRRREALTAHGEAHWARALGEVAAHEAHAPLACAHCGAALARPTTGPGVYQATNIPCPHCKALTTAQPGTATAMFYGGTGAHLLAREAALPAWDAMEDAEHRWHRLRHPTQNDVDQYEHAQRAYWRAYGEHMGRFHTGWTATHVEDEIRGKLSSFLQTTSRQDQDDRTKIGSGLAAVATGEAPHVVAWLQRQPDAESAAEALMTAAIERGWRDHVPWIAQIAAPVLGTDADWIAEKVDDVTYHYATSGRDGT